MKLPLWTFPVALALITSLQVRAEDEWIRVGMSYCRRLSPTFVMRDPASCGTGSVFCTAPIQCFGPDRGRGSVATVMCRAVRGDVRLDPAPLGFAAQAMSVAPGSRLGCPGLQQCADDPNPQLGFESDLLSWSNDLCRGWCGTFALSGSRQGTNASHQ